MAQLTPGDAQDLLERYKRAWEARDPDLAMELYAADAEFRLDPFEEPAHGENEIRAIWNDVAATQANVEFDAERTWAVGQTVLASWHVAFTRRSNAERVRLRGFSTFACVAATSFQIARISFPPCAGSSNGSSRNSASAA